MFEPEDSPDERFFVMWREQGRHVVRYSPRATYQSSYSIGLTRSFGSCRAL